MDGVRDYRDVYRDGEQGDRGFTDWRPNAATKQRVKDIQEAFAAYEGEATPMKRDIFYDLIGVFGYEKSLQLYKNVLGTISNMQRSRRFDLDFGSFNDDSYSAKRLRSYGGPSDFYQYLSKMSLAYRIDLIKNQPQAVHVVCEGKGRVDEFYRVTAPYCIPVYSPGGWDSVEPKYDTARAISYEYIVNERPTTILFCGDLDPDGAAREVVFEEDVLGFLKEELDEEEAAEAVTFKRLMATPEQIEEEKRWPFTPPPQESKNHRAKVWPLDFTAQMEAIPLSSRAELLREAIEGLIDRTQLLEDSQLEASQRQEVIQAVSNLGL